MIADISHASLSDKMGEVNRAQVISDAHEVLEVVRLIVALLPVAEMSDYMDKVDRLKCLVLSLPPPNHDTLQFMCRHLKR